MTDKIYDFGLKWVFLSSDINVIKIAYSADYLILEGLQQLIIFLKGDLTVSKLIPVGN